MLAWELTGAVIGAGMASGREIASFFSRYGGWGSVGIVLSIGMMLLLADAQLPASWKKGWFNRGWRLLQSLLLIFTGGAMLCGGGEIVSLVAPLHGAYWIGLAGTLALAWLLAKYTAKGLAFVSKMLLACLALMLAAGFLMPPMKGVHIEAFSPMDAVIRGVTYGGFNAALQSPILAQASAVPAKERGRAVRKAGITIGSVLLLGYAVLMRHPALNGETLPFIALLKHIGKAGYMLASICLYLAVLSTLTACLRGLKSSLLSAAAILSASSFGLSGVIDRVYPLLGGLCFLMLLAAKLMNSLIPPFHSDRNMI